MFRHLAIAGLMFAGILGASALGNTVEARTAKHAALIIDANTGADLHADQADALRYPASLTKMMTLYLVFETIESGRLSMSDRVVMSEHATAQAPSKLGLAVGKSLSVSEAIRALITKSANDVAVAVAEKIGGTESNFARLMTKRAHELGMKRTNFVNASGLPDDDQLTTARDMVTLALHLQDDFPKFYRLFATQSFSFNGKTYSNHNSLLRNFRGTDGIKTGYTRASGFNLVSSVRRGSRHVVGAVFGGRTSRARNAEMRNLLTRGLHRASTVKTRRPMFLARLKSPPRPAERPRRVEKPAPVAAAVPRYASAAAELRPAIAPAPVATAPAPRNAPPPIDVYKVKPVLMGARADQRSDAMARLAARAADAGAEAAAVSGGLVPTSYEIAAASDPERETVIAKTTPSVRPQLRSSLGPQIAMLGAQDARPVEPASASDQGAASVGEVPVALDSRTEPNPVQLGRPPSSLQAQATRLGDQNVFAPQREPVQAANSLPVNGPAARGYEIQIGAYGTIADAELALRRTQTQVADLLSGVTTVTHPVNIGNKQIYRARFAGFDASRASATCNALRRRSVDCFVVGAN